MKKILLYVTNYEGNVKSEYIDKMLLEFNNIDFMKIDVKIFTTEESNLNIKDYNNLNVDIIIHDKIFSNSTYADTWQPEPEFIWLYRKDILNEIDKYDMNKMLVRHMSNKYIELNDTVGTIWYNSFLSIDELNILIEKKVEEYEKNK